MKVLAFSFTVGRRGSQRSELQTNFEENLKQLFVRSTYEL